MMFSLGLWKKNRDDIWQDPLQAIQMEMGSSLNQAIQFAMNLSGITKEELCQLKSSQNQTMAGGIDSREKKLLEIKLKVQTAKAIWNASECIKGKKCPDPRCLPIVSEAGSDRHYFHTSLLLSVRTFHLFKIS